MGVLHCNNIDDVVSNFIISHVLGGPGSGKVTHCDTMMQERRGIVHINMTDLLQQYTVGTNCLMRFTLILEYWSSDKIVKTICSQVSI